MYGLSRLNSFEKSKDTFSGNGLTHGEAGWTARHTQKCPAGFRPGRDEAHASHLGMEVPGDVDHLRSTAPYGCRPPCVCALQLAVPAYEVTSAMAFEKIF